MVKWISSFIMQKKGISTYALIMRYHFSKGTLHSLKHNKNVSTATLNDLCEILDCRIEDVVAYLPQQS